VGAPLRVHPTPYAYNRGGGYVQYWHEEDGVSVMSLYQCSSDGCRQVFGGRPMSAELRGKGGTNIALTTHELYMQSPDGPTYIYNHDLCHIRTLSAHAGEIKAVLSGGELVYRQQHGDGLVLHVVRASGNVTLQPPQPFSEYPSVCGWKEGVAVVDRAPHRLYIFTFSGEYLDMIYSLCSVH